MKMETKYIGEVLNDGHLSIDQEVKDELHLEEGDKIEVSLKKLDKQELKVSRDPLSKDAQSYISYLVNQGLKGKALKELIPRIREIDQRHQDMTKNEILKEAFTVAEKRTEAWCRKYEINPEELSDDELMQKILNIRENA